MRKRENGNKIVFLLIFILLIYLIVFTLDVGELYAGFHNNNEPDDPEDPHLSADKFIELFKKSTLFNKYGGGFGKLKGYKFLKLQDFFKKILTLIMFLQKH